jgi:hypothetical protein
VAVVSRCYIIYLLFVVVVGCGGWDFVVT